MYALTPILTGLAGFLFWYAHGLRRGTPFFAKREQNSTKTPKDKFVVTVTAIIFLMYPTLCNQAFSLFSCKWVGNKQYLQADLEEPCYEGRHLSLALALGGSQLLVYVIGLPTLVLLFLRRNRAHESTNGSSTEPGADDTIADEANANKNVGVFDGLRDQRGTARPGPVRQSRRHDAVGTLFQRVRFTVAFFHSNFFCLLLFFNKRSVASSKLTFT